MAISQSLYYFLFLLIFVRTNGQSLTTVNTRQGPVQGHRVSANNTALLDVFLGVPYALPPVGSLRFARPVPVSPTRALHNATFYRPVCPQSMLRLFCEFYNCSTNNVNEDCLYLNVFAPQLPGRHKPLPVMVWFHGGAFTFGSASEYDGRVLALRGGVVVVTVDYRIGVMGYLSTDDKWAPGNIGQLDQLESLRWVKRNIEFFGGDPHKVTIFGQSSGGASVSTHLFSPLARGLFHGVIAQSGVALSPFAFYRPPFKAGDTARSLGKILGCDVTSSRVLVECLRNKSVDDLVHTRPHGKPPMTATYVPVVDGHYIRELPESLLARGQVLSVPLMTGTVPNEGADEVEYVSGVQAGLSVPTVQGLVHGWSSRYGNQSDAVYRAISCQYDMRSGDPVVNRESFIALKSNYGYQAPHAKLADGFSGTQTPTYLYSFEYRSPNLPFPKWEGVLHSTELYYVFGCPFMDTLPCPWRNCHRAWCSWTPTDTDRRISSEMMALWSNFAKHQNPNPTGKQGVIWPKYTVSGGRPYFEVKDTMSVHHDLQRSNVNFWNVYLPRVLAGKTSFDCKTDPLIIG